MSTGHCPELLWSLIRHKKGDPASCVAANFVEQMLIYDEDVTCGQQTDFTSFM